jgi:DNA-binding SARP family transcriptional activator
MEGRLTLSLLGGFYARLEPGGSLRFPARKVEALLGYLALPAGQSHPRDKLAALLWGDLPDGRARTSLRQALSRLRRALGTSAPRSLRLDGEAVALDPTAVHVDVAAFEQHVATGTPEALAEAAALYGGDLLVGLAVSEPPFEAWLSAERERLRELALEALARLLAHQRRAGLLEPAVQTAGRLLALDPLGEPVHRTLMRLYARLGRRGAALRQYGQCVAILRRELGVEPEIETRQLHQELLLQRSVTPAHTQLVTSAVAPWRALLTDTPLVGRDAEQTRLQETLESVRAGVGGRLVGILGAAGIGKSRLAGELVAEASRQGWRVLFGRAWEPERILPFAPWVSALRDGGVSGVADIVQILAPVWRIELARLLPELAHREDPPPPPRGDDRILFEAIGELLRGLSDRQPLVVWLEDIHWADEMSLRLLAFLGRRLATWRLLLVATAREEELGDAATLRHALEDLERDGSGFSLRLAALSEDETLALVDALSRGSRFTATAAAVGTRVWKLSRGNPFVAVETVRTLATHLTAASPGDRVPLAPRVRTLVLRSLERLGDTGRQIIDLAAVVGQEAEFALLQQASALDDAGAAAATDEGIRRSVLRSVGERIDFTHDWFREVVSAEIPRNRRRLLHRRVAEALESLYAGDLDAHALALAQHHREGERWDRAALHFWKAGGQAMARAAYREAVASFDQALAAVARLPDRRARLELGIDVRLDLRHALLALGEIAVVGTHLREAASLAIELGDVRREARVTLSQAAHLYLVGDYEGTVRRAQHAVDTVGAEDIEVAVEGRLRAALANVELARYRAASEILEATLASLAVAGRHARLGQPYLPAVRALSWLAMVHSRLGEFDLATRAAAESLELAEVAGDPQSLVEALDAVGDVHVSRGELLKALAPYERALEVCRAWHLRTRIPSFYGVMARIYAQVGREAESIALHRAAKAEDDAMGRSGRRASRTLGLGRAALLAGQLEEASRLAEQALDRAREVGQRADQSNAWKFIADIAVRREPPDLETAEQACRKAIGLSVELESRPFEARCRLDLGAVHRRQGRPDEARVQVSRAMAMFRAMGMSGPLAQAETELTLLGVSPDGGPWKPAPQDAGAAAS